MSRAPVNKELWIQLEPLISAFATSRNGGCRHRTISDEAAFNGILFVLHTGIPWEDLPQTLGYGSGMTCWRRLRQWHEAGELYQALLVRLREHDQIDWSRASIDDSSVPSPRGRRTGAEPRKPGSKQRIVVDAQGIPLVVLVSWANRHDSMLFERCLDAIPAVKGLKGHPRKRPGKLHVDKGYDYRRCRDYLRCRGILIRIARRGIESSERLCLHRWVVERTHGWFAGFGKLRIRFERRLQTHEALLKLAAAILCARFVDLLC